MASGNDMKAAEATYGGFLNMLKWGTGVTIGGCRHRHRADFH